MAPEPPRRIFLTGFSFSGKSQVAPLVAQSLGWLALDLDDLIEEGAGKPIPQVFADEGEPGFRQRERQALLEARRQDEVVVATGGGVVVAEENRRLMAEGGFVVCLEARPETIQRRMERADGGLPSERPLLSGGDPLGRIRHLKGLRQPLYALADQTVHTDDLTPQQVADEVARGWRSLAAGLTYTADRLADAADSALAGSGSGEDDLVCVVATETARYPVYAGWGIVGRLGERMRAAGLESVAYVVSDSNVHRHHGERVEGILRDAGLAVSAFVVEAGEASKTLESAARIFDWLTAGQAERGHPVVALGGGVTGDLAGFAAATYLRGLPLIQLPTSMLAMVDAAIGGKVAVNQRQAKNLIGAFYQPRLVFADVSMLQTLPERELTSGWAEVVKHALIMDLRLLLTLEEQVEALRGLQPEVTTAVVRRSMALKAQVVSEDERETTGRRSILNYGHTVGHALEAAAGYGTLLHGEAVALGMIAAAEIGRRLGLAPPGLAERQRALLERFGLIRGVRGIDADSVLTAMSLDKKVVGKDVRWVLLEDVGRPVLRTDVPASLVRQVVDELAK